MVGRRAQSFQWLELGAFVRYECPEYRQEASQRRIEEGGGMMNVRVADKPKLWQKGIAG